MFKTHGDFKHLASLLADSNLLIVEDLPPLPPKKTANGTRKLGSVLQGELEIWLREIVQFPVIARMLCVRFFFIDGA